jgi:hypothetical protein
LIIFIYMPFFYLFLLFLVIFWQKCLHVMCGIFAIQMST